MARSLGSGRSIVSAQTSTLIGLGVASLLQHQVLTDVSVGSKCEILALSLSFPLFPYKRTQVGHAFTSGKCQDRKSGRVSAPRSPTSISVICKFQRRRADGC